ncbi:IclR family transcriptional regulator [Orrella marina]|uniref:IclR family transcriptional regulator n=1 Tax=Orrella marina TaxID=2163011 RepID=UPI00131ED406|nr:IclR family transcriptional regulator [Orrella marina]
MLSSQIQPEGERDIDDTMLTVRRGIEVIRAFRAARVALGNVDIVKRTNIPKASVSRITSTLISLGLLVRVPGTRKFQIGTRPLSIGQAYLDASPMARLVTPVMQSLADELGVSSAIATRAGLQMLYVAYRKSENISTLRLGVGSLLPLDVTSVGRAYLWGMNESERDKVIEQIRVASGTKAEQRLKGISDAFTDLRTHGICMSIVEYQPDAFGVAVPVYLGQARTLMTLNAGAVHEAVTREYLLDVIREPLTRAAQNLEKVCQDVDCSL